MRLTGQQVLRLQLDSAVATNELSYSVSWYDGLLSIPGSKTGFSAGTTTRSMTVSPGNTVRIIRNIRITNLDTVKATVTVLRKDGSLNAIFHVASLLPGQYLNYTQTDGWVTYNGNGQPASNEAIVIGSSTLDETTVYFSNANNITFGVSGNTITASASVSGGGTGGGLTNIVIGAGGSTDSLSSFILSNSNNVSFGLNSGTITASASLNQTVQPVAVSLGNGSFNFSTLKFGDINGATFYSTNNSVALSYTVPSIAGLISAVKVSAGTLSSNVTQINFSNANGLSFGYDGNVITGSYTVPSTAGLISAINIGAGTTNSNISKISFVDSNGISFGLNGSSITASHNGITTQTNQDINFYALGNTTQNSSTIINAARVSFNGLGIITVGYSNGSIQISASQSSQSQSNPNVSLYGVGNTTQNSSTVLNASNLSFNGLGIVTVGYSNGSIQISASEVAQTNQNISFFGLGNTTQNSSTVINASKVSFNGLGIVTVGYSNGSIQISASQSAQSQSNQDISLFALGNTTQNSSSVINASALSIAGRGMITVGYSNGSIQISASQSAQSQSNPSVSLYALGNTTQNSSTVLNVSNLSFNGLGIVTVGYSNGSIQISASEVAQTNQNISFFGLGNTTQNSSTVINASKVSFNGLGIVTVGYSNGSIQISASQSVQTQSNQDISFYARGNTTQNSSIVLNASVVSFNGAGAVTVGYSNGSIQVSAPVQTNQNISLFGLGNTTQNSSTVLNASNISFNGLGIITVGYSNGSVQISANQSTQPAIQSIVVSDQTFTNGQVSLKNANGITFGSSGAGVITASYTVPSVPAQSNPDVSFYALGNTTQNSSTKLNVSNISFNAIGSLTVGYSNGSIQFSAPNALTLQSNQDISWFARGNTTQNSSSVLNASVVSLNGAGIITVGYSNGSIQISATQSVQSQSNQQMNLYAVSNTTQSTSITVDARTISFQGAGIASVGVSNGSVIISVPSGGGGISAINISAGATNTNISNVSFANSNGIGFGINGSTITASHNGITSQTNQNISFFARGNTTDSSSAAINASVVSFVGLGAATVGLSNGSIEISAPVQTNQNISFFALGNTTQNSSTVINASAISLNGLGGATVGYSNGSIEISAPSNVSIQYFEPTLIGLGLITNISSINTRPVFTPFKLPGHLTNNNLFIQMSRSTTGSNAFTIQAGLYTYVNSTSLALLGSVQNVFSHTNTADVSGIRYFQLTGWGGNATALTPGAYVLGLNFSGTASASMNYSLFGEITASSPIGFVLAGTNNLNTSNTSLGIMNFWGRYTVNSTGLPSNIAQADILANFSGASLPIAPYFALKP